MREQLKNAIIDGFEPEAKEAVEKLLAENADPVALVKEVLIPAMDTVAQLWADGDYFMSDVILCANAFGMSMDIITPALQSSNFKTHGKFMIGVVEGDMHDLGKNIVVAMLRANGFEVVDLGINVPVAKFVEAVHKEKPDILGIGAYMSTTMGLMKDVIDALKAEGLRDGLKISVGGVCVNEAAAKAAGADVFGGDAMHTVELAKKFMGVA